MMLQRKQGIAPESTPLPIAPEWPADQIQQLEDYCAKMGIVGFSSGRMNPLAALAMLQKQFGKDYSGVPLEERISDIEKRYAGDEGILLGENKKENIEAIRKIEKEIFQKISISPEFINEKNIQNIISHLKMTHIHL